MCAGAIFCGIFFADDSVFIYIAHKVFINFV